MIKQIESDYDEFASLHPLEAYDQDRGRFLAHARRTLNLTDSKSIEFLDEIRRDRDYKTEYKKYQKTATA